MLTILHGKDGDLMFFIRYLRYSSNCQLVLRCLIFPYLIFGSAKLSELKLLSSTCNHEIFGFWFLKIVLVFSHFFIMVFIFLSKLSTFTLHKFQQWKKKEKVFRTTFINFQRSAQSLKNILTK